MFTHAHVGLTRSGVHLFAFLLICLVHAPAEAQEVAPGGHALDSATHIVIPQHAGFAMARGDQAITIQRVDARIAILHQTATTVLEVTVRNPTGRRAEAVLLLPVPDGAVVSSFLFDGAASHPTAVVMEREEARSLYDRIVAQIRDPALLEFAGYNMIRSSVFPVEAGGAQKVRVTYEHLLSSQGGRLDYILPRSESLGRRTPWSIEVDVRHAGAISTVYSPSHALETKRLGSGRIRAALAADATTQPGAFRLSILPRTDDVSASLFAYPDDAIGGGYFLLMAGAPDDARAAGMIPKRELTIVIDRSGSMGGEKIEQARAAALQVVESLHEGELFNIIDYASNVARFSDRPVEKTDQTMKAAREYLRGIRSNGGTNIYDALHTALAQEHDHDALPIVLFLTDGLPTEGRTSEVEIRTMAEKANAHQRRIFTFGVGSDVNAPLLDRIADASRATTTYVLPGEDVEVKASQVFAKLDGPVLTNVTLATVDGSGAVTTQRVRDMLPNRPPDLFEDDQLIVLGTYRGDEPLRFVLEGEQSGRKRTFTFAFDLATASQRHAFVPRLWASRKIAHLVDEIRQAGALNGAGNSGGALPDDPRYRELSDEILRLSAEFGVLTEYTAFLAREGTDLSDWKGNLNSNWAGVNTRAVGSRAGLSAVNQSMNYQAQAGQVALNYDNTYFDQDMRRVSISTVRQISDRAFFRQGDRWIDGRLIAEQEDLDAADITIEFGSDAYEALLRRLIDEGRQGVLSLSGEIIIRLDEGNVLIRNGSGE
jgi:Ca-activated chloride channel family protein